MSRSLRILAGLIVIATTIVVGWVAIAGTWPSRSGAESTDRDATALPGVQGVIIEPDDGRAPLLDELAAARTSIDVMIYLLTDREIVNGLIDAEGRGVEVRVILEQYPYGGFGNPEEVAGTLREAGAEVRWASSDFTFSHAKMIIVDDEVVAILNLNLTRSAFESNREFGVVSTRPADVETARVIFGADWTGEQLSDPGSLVVSPINSRTELVRIIATAQRSIDIYAEVVRDAGMLQAIGEAEASGVEVRLLMSPDNEVAGEIAIARLIDAGVEVGFSRDLYMHAKVIIVDGIVAFVGSQNLTETSLDKNREVGLLIEEPELIARLMSTFALDFAAATPDA